MARDSYIGLAIALTIFIAWGGSLYFQLSNDLLQVGIPIAFAGIVLQTFLYTGLFITAHDAMHGSVYRINAKVNDFIGTLAVRFYALFSFPKLHDKHWEHHTHPASEDDPDFHDGEHPQFWRWYLHFLINYVSWKQIAGMAIVFNILEHLVGIPAQRLLLFWVLPSLLSTLQLFYFGTYLPHREEGGYSDEHHARSNEYSVFWSFITCYHFGYHWEHHAWPHVAWWKLPAQRRISLEKNA